MLEMLDVTEIWLAELEGDRRIQRRNEGAICEAAYQAPEPAASFQEPGMRRELRRPDEDPITVVLKPSDLLVGIANALAV